MSVPYIYSLYRVALSWGVPPWVVTGEQPTADTVSRWVTRALIFQDIGA